MSDDFATAPQVATEAVLREQLMKVFPPSEPSSIRSRLIDAVLDGLKDDDDC